MADTLDYTELDWRRTILLGVAVRDGLLEAVADGTCGANEVAADLGLDGRAVYAVLSALAELGVLEEGNEGLRLLDERRAPLLERDDPEYVGAAWSTASS